MARVKQSDTKQKKLTRRVCGQGFKSRGDRTPLELFLAGVEGWDAVLRRCFSEETCDT